MQVECSRLVELSWGCGRGNWTDVQRAVTGTGGKKGEWKNWGDIACDRYSVRFGDLERIRGKRTTPVWF